MDNNNWNAILIGYINLQKVLYQYYQVLSLPFSSLKIWIYRWFGNQSISTLSDMNDNLFPFILFRNRIYKS